VINFVMLDAAQPDIARLGAGKRGHHCVVLAVENFIL
jgi:hypothetical protein